MKEYRNYRSAEEKIRGAGEKTLNCPVDGVMTGNGRNPVKLNSLSAVSAGYEFPDEESAGDVNGPGNSGQFEISEV